MTAPFSLLALLEALFRLTGLYADARWDNPAVQLEEGTEFFPEWKTQIHMPKPAGTYRIFTLGGSTTQGFGVEHPFPMLLRERLAAQWPGRDWEIINGGVGAAGSHRIYEVLTTASQYDADLFVLYMGHNECLEEVFFDANGLLARQQRVARYLAHFRVVAWLRSMTGALSLGDHLFRTAKLQRHFIGTGHFPLIRSRAQLEQRLAFLEATLEKMIQYSREHHIRLIVIPEVANLMAKPGDSIHGPAYPAQSGQWEQLLSAAQGALQSQRWAEVRAALQAAHQIDDQFALSHYLLATALIRLGEHVAARTELEAANILDKRGDRINREIRERMLAVSERAHIPAIDIREAFYGRGDVELGPFGANLFLDHCHPTQRGHEIIADEITRMLRNQLG